MKRIAATVIAILAAVTVSVALVGCDGGRVEQKRFDFSSMVVEFDGGKLGVHVLQGDFRKYIEVEYNEYETYTFNLSYVHSDGSKQHARTLIVEGNDLGKHYLATEEWYPVLVLTIVPIPEESKLEAEVDFDSTGAISVIRNDDGLMEFTYVVNDRFIPRPDIKVTYKGAVVAKSDRKFSCGGEFIAKEIGVDSIIETYRLGYVVNPGDFVCPYFDAQFKPICGYIIVKVIRQNEAVTE